MIITITITIIIIIIIIILFLLFDQNLVEFMTSLLVYFKSLIISRTKRVNYLKIVNSFLTLYGYPVVVHCVVRTQ